MPLHGECNCGGVKVTVADQPPETARPLFCHCMSCRRQSGAGGTYVIVVPEQDVTIEGKFKNYPDNATDSGKTLNRFFCETCGCPIHSTSEVIPGKICVKMGLFNDVAKPMLEMYTRNRRTWEPAVEGIPQIPGAP